jgi:hypothetical protein
MAVARRNAAPAPGYPPLSVIPHGVRARPCFLGRARPVPFALEQTPMNDPSLLVQALNALGLGAYVPVALALIGLASAIATVYPPAWPGAAVLHKAALLLGRAAPATPAGKGPGPGPGPSGATAAAILVCLGAAALGACSAAQEQAACAVDAAVVPATDAALSASGGAAAVAGAVDAAAVHPAVQAGCAALAAPAAVATPPG